MQYEITRGVDTVVLHLRRHLAFAGRRWFIDLIPQLTEGRPGAILVNLSELPLSLCEAAEQQGTAISLRNPGGRLRALLKLSQFETMLPREHN